MSDTAITVDGVSKKFRLYHERNQSLKSAIMRRRTALYDEFWALDDVSLTIPAGSTFGLIGNNGSGKSTLLKCLAKIYFPDRGAITSTGRLAALLEVGTGFHPELSGRENIFLSGSILGMSRQQLRQKFEEIVEFSGVEKFIDQPVKNFSTGMYVRLGFAVAINVEPSILLVDEVLAVGDADFQEKCRQKFIELKAMGTTVVLVSHSMEAVSEMCDGAAWLDGGKLKACGTAASTIEAYRASRPAAEA